MSDARPFRCARAHDPADRALAALFELPLACPDAVALASSRIRVLLGAEPWLAVYSVNLAPSVPTARLELLNEERDVFEGHSVAELLEALAKCEAGLLELLAPGDLERRLEAAGVAPDFVRRELELEE